MEKSKFRHTQQHNLEHYEQLDKVPVSNSKRICTDILCTIVGLSLTIALAVFAIVLWNRGNYLKQVFPADTDGRTCGYQLPGYNVIYFAKPTQITNRVCVRSCPTSSSDTLVCKKTSGLNCQFGQGGVQYYDTQYKQTDYGEFCLPKDPGNRKVLTQQVRSTFRELYYNSVRTIQKTLIIVAIVSVVYMLLVQCLPKIMNRVGVVIGVLAILGLAITTILYHNSVNSPVKWVVFGIMVLFFLVMICVFAKHFATWGLYGIFLDFASKFVCQRIFPLIMPIVFLALGTAFYFFQLYQYRSYWSYGELRYDPSHDLYHKIQNPTKNYILSAFQILQIIWGTMFLKQAFNYLVSAEAVSWYYGKGSSCGNGLFTLVCKHIGSVIACAFMNSFFGILDFICDALIPDLDESNSPVNYCINRFAGFFDLARSDALTLVYLASTAYCNSARYCQYLVNKYTLTSQSQSISRIYRYAAHFAIAGVNCILAFWVYSGHLQVAFSGMGVLLFMSLGVATFFVSLHADAADAILILYLMEEQFIINRGKTSKQLATHKDISTQVAKYIKDSGLRGQESKL